MVNPEMLGMVISDLIFRAFGFGPSKNICDEFAGKVIEEAHAVGANLEMP
jgi:hypothetical protein